MNPKLPLRAPYQQASQVDEVLRTDIGQTAPLRNNSRHYPLALKGYLTHLSCIMNRGCLPISVITGFLGSGKTTLLARMLTHPGMDRTLVVVNDFGDFGLDHLLISPAADEVISLESGCLCCTLQGDLVETLKSIAARRAIAPEFDRVLIETTGLADPTGILHTLLTDPVVAPHFSVDAVIAVVNSVNGADTLLAQPASVRQVVAADHLVISKTDLAHESDVATLTQRIRHLNPTAEQHICVMGHIEPSVLLGDGRQKEHSTLAAIETFRHSESAPSTDRAHNGHAGPNHLVDGGIRSFTLRLQQPVTQDGLALWMHLISAHLGPALLRIKGIVNVAGSPVVIHAVRYLFYDPIELPEWPSRERDTRIVFITQGIDRRTVEWTFSAFALQPGQGKGLNPERYGQMSRVLQSFRRAGGLAQ